MEIKDLYQQVQYLDTLGKNTESDFDKKIMRIEHNIDKKKRKFAKSQNKVYEKDQRVS